MASAKSQIDGFHFIVRSIFARPNDLITMFALYCDDSGTHGDSPCAVAACHVAPVVQWEKFCDEWRRAEQVEKFGTFHMADFVGKYEQFASPEWEDQIKRRRVLDRLNSITRKRSTKCFFAVVDKKAYDTEIPDSFKRKHGLGSHYTFAVRNCLGKVLHWRAQHGHQFPITFMFDRMTKGSGEIDDVFRRHLKEGSAKDLGLFKGGWGFYDKGVVLPLQAADILAWETLWHMRNVVVSRTKKTPRKSFQSFLKNMPFDCGWHDNESLKSLYAHWVARGIAKEAI